MHGVMRSADEHRYAHMPIFFNPTCEKETWRALVALFREIRMNSDCYFSKQSQKVSIGKQPRKIKSWPTGREFKRTKF